MLFELEEAVFQAISRCGSIALVLFALACLGANAQVAPVGSAAVMGTVTDVNGKPVPQAHVSLSGPRTFNTTTDATGQFALLNIPFGIYRVTATSETLGVATNDHIDIEGDMSIVIAYKVAQAGNLKVIANVATTSTAQFNVSPASVASIDPTTAAFQGQTSWRHIVEQIPGVTIAGYDGGFSAYASGVTGNPFMPLTIAVDGALPYETSTLLDDMPIIGIGAYQMSGGFGTDLGFYPLNGFGGADVVRGPGANAPSIVDSIGGSFLLHAPSEVRANHYNFSVGTDPYGGIVSNAQAALRIRKLSIVATYGVNDSPGPLSSAVPFQILSLGLVNGTPFSCVLTCAFTTATNPNYNSPTDSTRSVGLFGCCVQNSSAWTVHSGSIALGYDISPAITAQVFYAGQSQDSTLGMEGQSLVNFVTPPGYTGWLQPGVQGNFSGAGTLATGSYLQPFLRFSSLVEEKISANVGKGFLKIAALQNRTSSLLPAVSPRTGTFQLFGSGGYCFTPPCSVTPGTPPGTSAYTPVIFNGGVYTVSTTNPASAPGTSLVYNATNNRDAMLSFTEPLTDRLRAGASFVQSYYDSPSETDSNGAVLSLRNANQHEFTREVRVSLDANPVDKLSIDLSGYFVNAVYHVQNPAASSQYLDQRFTYSAPRLGIVWRPRSRVAVRASLGGGFALAPLTDMIGTNGAVTCTSGIACSEGLQNLNLQPETSFAFDLGTDVRLHDGTIVSFDVYRANLYGQVFSTASFSGNTCSSVPTCPSPGTNGTLPLYITQFGNIGKSRYEGILLDIKHDVPHGIYWHLAGGLTHAYVVSVPPGFYNTAAAIKAGVSCASAPSATNCQNLAIIPGINFTSPQGGGGLGANVPYSQGSGSIGFRWSPQKFVELEPNYYGPNNAYYRKAFMEFDALVSYPVNRHAALLATFQNITGIYDAPYATNFTDGNTIGAPAQYGPPLALYGENYGVRTVILTLNVK